MDNGLVLAICNMITEVPPLTPIILLIIYILFDMLNR